jgi:predicted HicB family RNase H-like nuclease
MTRRADDMPVRRYRIRADDSLEEPEPQAKPKRQATRSKSTTPQRSEAAKSRLSRRLAVTVPLSLAEELEGEATRQDVSVNALIASILAGALNWRPPRERKRPKAKK